MDMTLDQIIKMSKKPTQRGGLKNHRIFNKNQKFGLGSLQGHGGRGNPLKMRQFMDSREHLLREAPARNIRPFNCSRHGNWNKQRFKGLSLEMLMFTGQFICICLNNLLPEKLPEGSRVLVVDPMLATVILKLWGFNLTMKSFSKILYVLITK
ncbi:hypothetical protein MKW98_028867 [Papaver atlanticum]|uniref:Uncharacterized protein n=1 Tax=Papaver atlanticum TaxID=357466 RepID=A0AAD4X8A4_9MAGN|nr:hypothetical protein MKW98_028867 [Papaver atlanticum]